MSAILSSAGGKFRPMSEADLPEIMEIERRAYPYPWTIGILRDCLRVGYNCWLYEQNGVIQAYGVMSVAAGEAHVLNLCVRPESQGSGLGRRMLTQLIALARRHGADTLLLEVRPSNLAALHLYRKMGFNEVGSRKNYYPAEHGREDALIFALSL
ncbi:MAG: ribosomal protein S18-alanine N-acetyltransferase [Gammaproteobacteria bacterium]|jgi:ribosomal-protein-alanine N-acetyltransferase|nr:ribosomal protein S18-alanine N-acetyltransferase [Gammaproteobacteria bacterium]